MEFIRDIDFSECFSNHFHVGKRGLIYVGVGTLGPPFFFNPVIGVQYIEIKFILFYLRLMVLSIVIHRG